MKTFNAEKKKLIVDEIIRHRLADQIVQGTYGKEDNGVWKGCAVGCAIHSLNVKLGKDYKTSEHSVYETEFGIPLLLANLQDRIFEGLSVAESKVWPENFMSAVPEEADLSLVWPKFAVWLLVDEKDGVLRFATTTKQTAAIEGVAEFYRKVIIGEKVFKDDWADASAAASAAYAVAASASVAYAAAAAASDAYAAAASAAYAASAAVAAYGHYTKMAAKLIEILKAA